MAKKNDRANNGTSVESVNVSNNGTSVELVNVDLLAGLADDGMIVAGVDVDTKTFRSGVLVRYNAVPFGSFADWSVSDEGLAYRSKAESMCKDKKRVANVLVSAYDKLKSAHDAKESKRVITFTAADMVRYIYNTCDNEFRALVGCSVADVAGVSISANGDNRAKVADVVVDRLSTWSLVPNKFTKKDDLIQTFLTDDQMATSSVVLSALLSYKNRVPRLVDEVAKDTAKVARCNAAIDESASKAVGVRLSLDDYLTKCKESYFAAIESNRKAQIDADAITANVVRLRGLLADESAKLSASIEKKRTAAVKKHSFEVARLERMISDGVRTLMAGGFSVEGLTEDVNKVSNDSTNN